jgi:hypothetical protein
MLHKTRMENWYWIGVARLDGLMLCGSRQILTGSSSAILLKNSNFRCSEFLPKTVPIGNPVP